MSHTKSLSIHKVREEVRKFKMGDNKYTFYPREYIFGLKGPINQDRLKTNDAWRVWRNEVTKKNK